MILAGDIGGTKTNLAYFSNDAGRLVRHTAKGYPSRQHASLGEIVEKFTSEFPSPITRAAFGVAGPVIGTRCETTNLSWVVDSSEIARQLGLNSAGLVNDLEATGYGTLRLEKEDMIVLQSGVQREGAARAVIAAGTGLGEGGLVWDGHQYRALASEGGHTDFGPRNELEVDLLWFLLQRYQRVSYERIISGSGMQNLYDFFRGRSGVPEPPWLTQKLASGDPAAAISQAGLDGSDAVCMDALETFVSIYGAETGNLALKLLSTGGVYVGGGIAPKILPKILDGPFLKSFTSKGRYEKVLKAMPVCVVLNDKTALIGAAHYALMTSE